MGTERVRLIDGPYAGTVVVVPADRLEVQENGDRGIASYRRTGRLEMGGLALFEHVPGGPSASEPLEP